MYQNINFFLHSTETSQGERTKKNKLQFDTMKLDLLPRLMKTYVNLKGEVLREFDVISKPKNVCLSIERKKTKKFLVLLSSITQCNETVD